MTKSGLLPKSTTADVLHGESSTKSAHQNTKTSSQSSQQDGGSSTRRRICDKTADLRQDGGSTSKTRKEHGTLKQLIDLWLSLI